MTHQKIYNILLMPLLSLFFLASCQSQPPVQQLSKLEADDGQNKRYFLILNYYDGNGPGNAQFKKIFEEQGWNTIQIDVKNSKNFGDDLKASLADKNISSDDRLVVYIAGHGGVKQNVVLPDGENDTRHVTAAGNKPIITKEEIIDPANQSLEGSGVNLKNVTYALGQCYSGQVAKDIQKSGYDADKDPSYVPFAPSDTAASSWGIPLKNGSGNFDTTYGGYLFAKALASGEDVSLGEIHSILNEQPLPSAVKIPENNSYKGEGPVQITATYSEIPVLGDMNRKLFNKDEFQQQSSLIDMEFSPPTVEDIQKLYETRGFKVDIIGQKQVEEEEEEEYSSDETPYDSLI